MAQNSSRRRECHYFFSVYSETWIHMFVLRFCHARHTLVSKVSVTTQHKQWLRNTCYLRQHWIDMLPSPPLTPALPCPLLPWSLNTWFAPSEELPYYVKRPNAPPAPSRPLSLFQVWAEYFWASIWVPGRSACRLKGPLCAWRVGRRRCVFESHWNNAFLLPSCLLP